MERESGRILVVYNNSYMLANKVWRNITIRQIRQTLVPPNFRRLRYYINAWHIGVGSRCMCSGTEAPPVFILSL